MERNEEIDQRMHERLCALVLGEVDEAERAALEAELLGSAALRGERERLEQTIGLVRGALGAADLQLSAASRERISAAAQRPSHARRWHALPRSRLLRMAAGALALAGAGWIAVRARSDRGQSEEEMTFARLDHEAPAMKRERDSSADALNAQLEFKEEALRDGSAADAAAGAPASDEQLAKVVAAREGDGGTNRGPGSAAPTDAAVEKLSFDDSADAGDAKNVFQQLDELSAGKDVSYAPHANPSALPSLDGDAPKPQARAEFLASNKLDVSAQDLEQARVEAWAKQAGGEYFGPIPDGWPSSAGPASGVGASAPAAELGEVAGTSIGVGAGGGASAAPPSEGQVVTGEPSAFVSRRASAGAARKGRVAAPGPTGPSSPGPATPGTAGASVAGLGYTGGSGQDAASSHSDDFFLGRSGGRNQVVDALTEARIAARRFLQGCTFSVNASGFLVATAPDGSTLLFSSPDDLVQRLCSRIPSERPRDMFFRWWGDNAFEVAAKDSLSTFGADVDTASYALARSYLRQGHVPEKAQIRTEEFVNYFEPDLAPPAGNETFALHLELAPSRFGGSRSERWMLRAGLRGREVSRQDRKPVALTFVTDVSGSMKEGNRMELVKHALRLLTAELHASDTISIVAFSNDARLVLPATSASQRGLIEAALFGLEANGGTNAAAGLRLGYEQALANKIEGAVNRVVLLSDGVANIGQTNQDRINADVERQRDQGILLNTVGVGMNNHNDTFLEQLADKGDGLCNYIDTPAEARRALVDNFTGAFEAIAKDVKIQVEFDPSQVRRYRLLGYENRAIADQDFRNDRVDAGEIGAGHQVTALYELELAGPGDPECAIATLRVRYKGPEAKPEDAAREISRAIGIGSASGSFGGTTSGYRRSAIVAQFAELLRRSVHARGDSLDELMAEAGKLERELKDPDFTEFCAMLDQSRSLVLARLPQPDELALAIDGLRECAISRAELEELGSADAGRMNELLRQEAILQQKIRELWERMQQSRDR